MASLRSCPVCGQQNTRTLFRPKQSPGPVSKCLNCGMVYVEYIEDDHALIFDGPVMYGQLDPHILTSANLADVANSWELKLLPNKESEWPALQQNAMNTLDRIGLHTQSPCTESKILDFGSGWGFFLSVAKECGWQTTGLEPLPASAVYARATFGLEVVTDTLHENTFPPECFDVITSLQVFEHIPYPDQDLRCLHKMLRPGGLVLIEVPNIDTWTVRVMRSRHRHFMQDHINFFSVETLSRLLAASGIEIVDHYYPTRRMSVRHLFRYFRRQMPAAIADGIQNTLQKTSLWEKTLAVNVKDIITVIGRKRERE